MSLYAEEVAQRVEHHVVSSHFAVGRVACYVWCGDVCLVEQFGVYVRFVLPCVYYGVAHYAFVHCLKQCILVHNASAAGVHHRDALSAKPHEETAVGKMHGGMLSVACQWHVEGDDICLAPYCVEAYKFWKIEERVVDDNVHAEFLAHRLHLPAYMPIAHDAERGTVEVQTVVALECEE